MEYWWIQMIQGIFAGGYSGIRFKLGNFSNFILEDTSGDTGVTGR